MLSWNSKISISSPSTRSKNCQRLKINKSYDSLVSIYRIWEITWGNWTLKLVHCEFDQVNSSFTLQLFSGEAHLEITNKSCRFFSNYTSNFLRYDLHIGSKWTYGYVLLEDDGTLEGPGDKAYQGVTDGQGQVGGALS